jgi:hypothetical protein
MASRQWTRTALLVAVFAAASLFTIVAADDEAHSNQEVTSSGSSALSPPPPVLDDTVISAGGVSDGSASAHSMPETATADKMNVTTEDQQTFDLNATADNGTTKDPSTPLPPSTEATGAPAAEGNNTDTTTAAGSSSGSGSLLTAAPARNETDAPSAAPSPPLEAASHMPEEVVLAEVTPLPSALPHGSDSDAPASFSVNDSTPTATSAGAGTTSDRSAASEFTATHQSDEVTAAPLTDRFTVPPTQQGSTMTPNETTATPTDSNIEATLPVTGAPANASTELHSNATASPIPTDSTSSITPPPTTSTPPPTTATTTEVPASPTELEARLQRFCRHTTRTAELRHPIVFGRRVTVSEFLLICKGLTKSPQFFSRMSQRDASSLSADACGVLKATDVSRLAHVFGRLSQVCIVSIPGASWRGVKPSAITQLFGTQQGRRSFNLVANISGLPLDSIEEVERQSGCFSKKQCNSLLYRGPEHQPKVCTRYETSNMRATVPLQDSSQPEVSDTSAPTNETNTPNAASPVTMSQLQQTSSRKEELGSGPVRSKGEHAGGPSLIMPVAAGIITACILFTWSHIRRRK